MRLSSCCLRGDRNSQEVQMCSWANFYRGLANEARERAARASNVSIKDKFEEVAKEWSALSVWTELKRSRHSRSKSHLGILAAKPSPPRKGPGLSRLLIDRRPS